MTIELGRSCAWLASAACLAAVALLAFSCTGANKLRHGDAIDVSSYPKDIQDAYEVFATRCSRCHTLARPLNARIHDSQHWVRYVARMRRNPTSGINEKNAEVILRFLLYYMHQRDAEESRQSEPEASPDLDAPSAAPESTEQSRPSGALEPAATPRAEPDFPKSPPPAAAESTHATPAAHPAQPANAADAINSAKSPAVAPQRSP